MDLGKDYSTMIQEQNKLIRILPLGMAWEFIPRPARYTVQYESESLARLAKQNHWQLSPLLRQFLRQPNWTMVVTDRWQVIQYVNESFELMTGYSKQETMGRKPNFLQGPETDPLVRQRIKTAVDQEQFSKERILNYRKDGSMYWCDISIFPINNGQHQLVNFIAFERETAV